MGLSDAARLAGTNVAAHVDIKTMAITGRIMSTLIICTPYRRADSGMLATDEIKMPIHVPTPDIVSTCRMIRRRTADGVEPSAKRIANSASRRLAT
jgi:hypothetical protein